MKNYHQEFETNKKSWNTRTPVHIDSSFYDLEGFKKGQTALREVELAEVGEVQGKKLLHLQCHFGMDTLSWAREGAMVTGLDFSDAAIAQAQLLAEELTLPAEFICANVYDQQKELQGSFDIVFSSYGVLGWLPDLKKWAEIIRYYLKPDGFFYLIEFHPFIWMHDDAIDQIIYPYFNNGPDFEVSDVTYTDSNGPVHTENYYWNHPLSETMMALIAAGFQIEFFHEFPFSSYACFSNLKEIGPHRYVFKHLEGKIPYMYSIKARFK